MPQRNRRMTRSTPLISRQSLRLKRNSCQYGKRPGNDSSTSPPLPVWTLLEPSALTATGDAKFAKQTDGSFLVSGENKADGDVYADCERPLCKGITAFRLETLPDASLPAQGPGRVAHGNFVLSEFKVAAASGAGDSQPVELAAANADFSQDQWPVAAAIDGDLKTGWAIVPHVGKRHLAVFETKADLDAADDTTLTVVLDQQYGMQHTIGRFRLSATTMPRPVKADGLPDDVAAILPITADQRTDDQRQKLLAYYATIDPELMKLRQAETEHAKQAPAPGDKGPDARGDFSAAQNARSCPRRFSPQG